jgi:hypothetical protein
MLTPRLESIPAELRQIPRWVCWRNEQGRKVLYDAKSLQSRASSIDPQTWTTFEEAETAFLERVGEDDAFTGVGIVLDGDGLAGIDIDHCVVDGNPDPVALALLDKLGAAYVEISPSGTGLRAFGYAEQLDSGCKGKHDGLDVELYSTGRYLTMTGHAIKSGPIGQLQGFQALADRIRSDKKVNATTGEIVETAPDERQAELVRRILSGDVYHDSLRDLAASLVATGMKPGAVVNHLRGLMEASTAPKDAGSALAHAVVGHQRMHKLFATLRGQSFRSTTSFKALCIRARSATMRLSRAFSPCSSRSCARCGTVIPEYWLFCHCIRSVHCLPVLSTRCA